eukprot:715185-Hanusia_phi.AAC.1
MESDHHAAHHMMPPWHCDSGRSRVAGPPPPGYWPGRARVSPASLYYQIRGRILGCASSVSVSVH